LPEESLLTDDFVRQLMNVGEVDLLVGLPTHNNATTVGPVVQAIRAGLLKCFPRERTAILNVDGGSRDGTPNVITAAAISDDRRANLYALRTLPSISTRYASSPSSETSLHSILSAAELLRARACAVVSPESVNLEPDWIARLLRPVYHDNFDFVAPIYRRHKFEGILVSNVIYPMMRALYGQRIREPYSSEFGFSGRFSSQFLAQHPWRHEAGQFGTELEMLLSAVTSNHRISQSFLGTKSHSDHHADNLVAAMRQTAGVLFSSLDANFAAWSSSTGSTPITTAGPEYETLLDPTRVNRKRLKEMFSAGVAELQPVLRSILAPATLENLQKIATVEEEDFRYPPELWATTVYEFAASHHKSVMSRDHIVQALVPLFRGRMFTVLVENRNASSEQIESGTEQLCREFERLKPYLLDLWIDGKRGTHA
jgi:hypothetical protein